MANEHRLLQQYQIRNETRNLGIIRQSIGYASRLIFWLFILFIFALLSDFLVTRVLEALQIEQIGNLAIATNSIPEGVSVNSGVVSLVQIYVGVIATIFGLFFALYIAGFELTTQEYSRDVAQFVNEESVSVFFFKWLLFAILFNIVIIIRIWLIELPAIGSFIVTTGISIFAILTTIVYRNHSVLASRPENILKNILVDFDRCLTIVTDRDSSDFKSVSLSKHASERLRKLCEILRQLYDDLLNKGNTRAASVVPIAVAEMLSEYITKRHLLEDEMTFWFPEKYQPVRRDDSMMGTIFSYYAIRGDASMQLPSRNERWLEELLFDLFDRITRKANQLDKSVKEDLFYGIINAYESLLYGSHVKNDSDRSNIKVAGLFEKQSFDEFEVILSKFTGLIEYIQQSDYLRAGFINAVYLIGHVILEGFREADTDTVTDFVLSRPLPNYEELYRLQLPSLARNVVSKYWYMLDTENQIEGQIVTPEDVIRREITTTIQLSEREYVEKYTQKLIALSNECGEFAQTNELIALFRGQLNWIKKALSTNKHDILTQFEGIFTDKILEVILGNNPQILIESELKHDLDDLCYILLTRRQKTLFNKFADIQILVYLNLLQQNQNTTENISLQKSLIAIGALAFAYSELDQDPYWVETYSAPLVKIFVDTNQMIKHFKTLTENTHLFYESLNETEYRRRWYQVFENEIQKLSTIHKERTMSVVPNIHYDHVSKFVQKFRPEHPVYYMTERKCMEGYIEWLETNSHRLKVTTRKQ